MEPLLGPVPCLPMTGLRYPDRCLLSLPIELFLKVCLFLPLRQSLLLSGSCRELYFVYCDMVIKRTRKYVLKDQGDIGSLLLILMKSERLEYIVLDCRNKHHCETGDCSLNSSMTALQDFHLAYFTKRDHSHLHSLVLKGCSLLTNVGFLYIANGTKNLTALDLSNMPNLTSVALIRILCNNRKLAYISLEKSYNAVNDEVLRSISTYNTKVKTLSISYCSMITDVGLLFLGGKCKELTELSLAHCYDLSAAALSRFFSMSPQLSVISLEWCFNVDDDVLLSLATSCRSLTVLGVEHCVKVTDLGMASCVNHLAHLNFLSLDGCEDVASSSIYAITGQLSNLLDLYVNCCPLITDQEVANLTKACKKLRSVGIEECHISDDSLRMIADNCLEIKVLGLNGNSLVGDTGAIYLVRHCPEIEKLYLSYTKITNLTLNAIRKYSMNMKSLSIVGCTVDCRGLLLLGSRNGRCFKSLQDLHLSNSLRQFKNFYAPFSKSYSSQSHRHAFISCSTESKTELLVEENDREGTLSDMLHDSESSFGDDQPNIEDEGEKRKSLNLRQLIFGKSPCVCMIYYR